MVLTFFYPAKVKLAFESGVSYHFFNCSFRVDHDVATAFFRETAAFTAGEFVTRFDRLLTHCRSVHKTVNQRHLFCLQVLPTKSSIVMTLHQVSAATRPDRREPTGGSWLRAQI